MSTAHVKAVTGKMDVEMEFDDIKTLQEAERKAKDTMRRDFHLERVHLREIQLSNGKSRDYGMSHRYQETHPPEASQDLRENHGQRASHDQ